MRGSGLRLERWGHTFSPHIALHIVNGWPGNELRLGLAGKGEERTHQRGCVLEPTIAVLKAEKKQSADSLASSWVVHTDMHNRTFRTRDSRTFCPESQDFG